MDQDLFSYLQSDCLLSLCIVQAFQDEKMFFSAGSFPKLQSLVIHGAPQLRRIEIEEGSMANLVRFTVTGCLLAFRRPRITSYVTARQNL